MRRVTTSSASESISFRTSGRGWTVTCRPTNQFSKGHDRKSHSPQCSRLDPRKKSAGKFVFNSPLPPGWGSLAADHMPLDLRLN